jgi:HPt (histidine-containing phosphotransfer) domain-containing protein
VVFGIAAKGNANSLRAFARAEYNTIRVLGHNLNGTGEGYGFSALSEMGASLEIAAKQEDRPAMQDLLQRLASYLDRVECRLAG